jgi:hypothetical protein
MSCAVALACGWGAWGFVRQVARVSGTGGSERLKDLGERSLDQRLAWLQAQSTGDRWEHELSRRLAAEPDQRQRVAVVNETLDVVDHQLHIAQGWPRVAGWICAAGCALAGLAGVLTLGLRVVLLGTVVAGVAGVAACVAAGRQGQRLAARARGDIDGLVTLLVDDLAEAEIDLPQRRQMRWRRQGRR